MRIRHYFSSNLFLCVVKKRFVYSSFYEFDTVIPYIFLVESWFSLFHVVTETLLNVRHCSRSCTNVSHGDLPYLFI